MSATIDLDQVEGQISAEIARLEALREQLGELRRFTAAPSPAEAPVASEAVEREGPPLMLDATPGERVAEMRRRRGLAHVELAKRVGVGSDAVALLERAGRKMMRRPTAERYARALDVPVEWLLTGDPRAPSEPRAPRSRGRAAPKPAPAPPDAGGLGSNLRVARGCANKRLPAAAKALGVAVARIEAWEQGRERPDADQVAQLARLYRTTARKLLAGDADVRRAAEEAQRDADIERRREVEAESV